MVALFLPVEEHQLAHETSGAVGVVRGVVEERTQCIRCVGGGQVEIADDAGERAQGLMHRTSLAGSAGMLFIYEEPQPLSFWMRNTLIPLDLLFIDSRGVVQHIHHNAIPLDESPLEGGSDALLAVLEINGGLSARMGITPGTELRHPAFAGRNPAWPC